MERTEAGPEERNFLEEVQRRQREGGDLNAGVREEYGYDDPPLIVAARRDWCMAARWLLDHGANVDVVDYIGWTALHNTACHGKYELMCLLLDAGARIDFRSLEQNSALHFIAGDDAYERCKLLLSRGAAYDIRNTKGQDPETRMREKALASAADLVADVRRAGGWAQYVAAPRAELLELRRTLPTLRHTPSVPLLERLFKEVPEDVFVEVFAFWRSPRDL